ncbi:hypothetical protein ISN44_As07g005120 [Arabidopsis suecica]|uniref:Uncharacterized protein n=1 Tax=Arabidopsis suecica TaxID=45249 RepID=A0A8T2BL98_ARASU|nr:hypothetical protein ISN44_As07g005120 [Arabidopsis suecica]
MVSSKKKVIATKKTSPSLAIAKKKSCGNKDVVPVEAPIVSSYNDRIRPLLDTLDRLRNLSDERRDPFAAFKELRAARKEASDVRSKAAVYKASIILNNAFTVGTSKTIRVLVESMDDTDADSLKSAVEHLISTLEDPVVVVLDSSPEKDKLRRRRFDCVGLCHRSYEVKLLAVETTGFDCVGLCHQSYGCGDMNHMIERGTVGYVVEEV